MNNDYYDNHQLRFDDFFYCWEYEQEKEESINFDVHNLH